MLMCFVVQAPYLISQLLYINVTFMGPCIVDIFLSTTNKMQRYTVFFIVVSALHVTSNFSAYHQELKNRTCSIGYLSNLFAATANMVDSEFQLNHVSSSSKQV